MAIDKKLIDAADKGLHGMVYQNHDGAWHSSLQDWVNLKQYVEPVLALIEAARKDGQGMPVLGGGAVNHRQRREAKRGWLNYPQDTNQE